MRVTRQAKRARLSGFEWFTPTLKPFTGWTFPSGRVTSIPSYGGLLSCFFFKLSNSNWWCWEILDQKKPQFYIISSRWRVSMASDWQLVAGWLHLVEFSSWFQLGTWIGVSFLTFTQVWLEIGLKIGGDFIWVLETGQNCVWSWAEIPNLTENWFRNWLKFYFHFGHNSKFNWKLVEILVKISFEFPNLPENWFRNWEEFHLNFGDWSELQLNSSFWIKFEIEMKIGWEIGDNFIWTWADIPNLPENWFRNW